MSLSPNAGVPLENIAAYNPLGSHEERLSKNIFGSCGRRWNRPLEGVALQI